MSGTHDPSTRTMQVVSDALAQAALSDRDAERWHLSRELAQVTGLSVSSVASALTRLENVGIVESSNNVRTVEVYDSNAFYTGYKRDRFVKAWRLTRLSLITLARGHADRVAELVRQQ